MSKYKKRSKTLTQIYNLPKILIWQASKYKAHKNPPKVHPPCYTNALMGKLQSASAHTQRACNYKLILSNQTWYLTSTKTIRLIRDGTKGERRQYGGGGEGKLHT